jgi:hypothetical protein
LLYYSTKVQILTPEEQSRVYRQALRERVCAVALLQAAVRRQCVPWAQSIGGVGQGGGHALEREGDDIATHCPSNHNTPASTEGSPPAKRVPPPRLPQIALFSQGGGEGGESGEGGGSERGGARGGGGESYTPRSFRAQTHEHTTWNQTHEHTTRGGGECHALGGEGRKSGEEAGGGSAFAFSGAMYPKAAVRTLDGSLLSPSDLTTDLPATLPLTLIMTLPHT